MIEQGHACTEALRSSSCFDRIGWRRSVYYGKSGGDAKTHPVKRLGQCLDAHDFDRQIAEFRFRGAVLNGFAALTISVT
jgi:hypothetical protein